MVCPWNLGYGSFKVIENDTNRQIAYKFLFVFHCNYGCILYCFRDKARYWSKIAIFIHNTPRGKRLILFSWHNRAARLVYTQLYCYGSFTGCASSSESSSGGTAPAYLSDSLRLTSEIVARRCLRSADTATLRVPSTRRATLGDGAFPVAAARAWNSLPPEIRACSSLETFRMETKSHRFCQSYGWLNNNNNHNNHKFNQLIQRVTSGLQL